MNFKTRYQCPVCKSGHDTKYLAETCCPHDVETILVCGECGVWFAEYETDKAEACCKNKAAYRLWASEVERAKRFCLCGEPLSPADVRDSKLLGTLTRCRSCTLSVAPEMQTAEQIARAA